MRPSSLLEFDTTPRHLRTRHDDRPVLRAAQALRSKWHHVVLARLLERPMGFNALRESVPRIDGHALARALHTLERGGIVHRGQPGPGRKGAYSLTTKGVELGALVVDLAAWSRRWGRRGNA